jgi:hypothetical protein
MQTTQTLAHGLVSIIIARHSRLTAWMLGVVVLPAEVGCTPTTDSQNRLAVHHQYCNALYHTEAATIIDSNDSTIN